MLADHKAAGDNVEKCTAPTSRELLLAVAFQQRLPAGLSAFSLAFLQCSSQTAAGWIILNCDTDQTTTLC